MKPLGYLIEKKERKKSYTHASTGRKVKIRQWFSSIHNIEFDQFVEEYLFSGEQSFFYSKTFIWSLKIDHRAGRIKGLNK